ncbi:uncharacterized protein LOC109839661 [Asparagus officinalis]|uniref:uncharacterized protein LOC109839661 n=1 Tax=Asparagus officinalis TaxID=4686 RepID=UPI00098DF67C|nr:uncharacterized protein LOC109839661 [Asparagus officinalis]XP_020263765.1 uncharacterized protein LOC109839661 [Asparagus officinalis]XP_020263766.1 uncharacterized protein LOC109839661 [Asparagus officinalis]XP_020263768.1 uncharacterized protein LOC109839661 [Asparagus officinalis]
MEHNYIVDRSWMYKEENERFEDFFIAGVDCFIEFALQHSVERRSNVCCPCRKCQNRYSYDTKTIKMHIVKNGFVHGYTKWYFHGENRKRHREETINVLPSRDDMAGMLTSIYPSSLAYENDTTSDSLNRTGRDRNAKNFESLIEDAKKPLYPNCQKYSKLSFIVRLFQIKCLNKWSNKSLSSLLELLKDLLPEDNLVPKTWYEAKKVMDEMGLKCDKIHACCNDCVLFRGEYENLNTSYNVESSINNSQLQEELDVANQKIQELYVANKKIQELHEEIQKRAEEAEREKAREKEERDYQMQEMQRIVSSFQAMVGLNRQTQ